MSKASKPNDQRVAVRATNRGFYRGQRIREGDVFFVTRAEFEAQAVKKNGFKWFEPTEPSAVEEVAALAKDAAIAAKKAKDDAVIKKLEAEQGKETKRIRAAQAKARSADTADSIA